MRARLDPEVCLTAGEAYPKLERAFLAAEREIIVSFRIFDPATKLRSPEARAIGEDWFDLVVHVLRRGVRITLYISDFDPIVSTDLHQATWESLRRLVAAREVAQAGKRFHFVAAAHPARVGLFPTVALYPLFMRELRNRAAELSALDGKQLARTLEHVPGLRPFLRESKSGVRPLWRLPRLTPTTHHQKVAVFDRELLTVGGLDLDERRFDTKAHERPADETWHDVQIFVRDRDRAEAAVQHILHLQRVTGGLTKPPETPGLLRTLSRRRRVNLPYISPHTIVREIAERHQHRIAAAERLIYLESQYFRDLELAEWLARAARRNPGLGLILMIPAAPEEIAFNGLDRVDTRLGELLQARCVRKVAAAFGERLFVGAPARRVRHDSDGRDSLGGAPIIYVHAKLSIFDDTAAMVSSANLNGRSLSWDTEAAVELTDRADIDRLRERCFRHWLPDDADGPFFDPDAAPRAWRRLAEENLRTDPEKRRGFLLPYDPAPAERFGRAVPVVPNAMV